MSSSAWRSWTLLHVLFFVTFFVSGLCVNAVQLALYVGVATWNRSLFRALNYYLVWMLYSQLLFLADWWSSSELRLHGPKELFSSLGCEHGLIVMNHHYEIDWLYGWMVADRYGQTLGNARVCVKKILRFMPVVGWAWTMSDIIFLERNWEKDKESLKRGIQAFCDYPDPMWYLLFAEGTRFTSQKYEASAKFAKERGLPHLKHHLLPRTKGFTYTLENVDVSRMKTLYDVTLVFDDTDSQIVAPTLSNVLSGKKVRGEIFVRKIDLSNMKLDEENATKFLYQLYEEKDSLKDFYIKHGRFPTGERGTDYEEYMYEERGPRFVTLLNTVLLNAMVHFPLTKLMLGLIFSGSLWQASIPLILYGGMYLFLKKMIGITKISKGSSYGNKKSD